MHAHNVCFRRTHRGKMGIGAAIARISVTCAFIGAPLWAGQSLRLNGTQTASNTSVAAQGVNSPCRVEFQLTFAANPANGVVAHAYACGAFIQFNGNSFNIYNDTTTGWACCTNFGLSVFASNWVIMRFQQIPSGVGGTLTWEFWDINGVRQYSVIQPYTGTSGSHSNGVTVGSTGNQDSSWGFFRLYNTTVPSGSREPTFADSGNLLDWKFNGTLADTTSNHYNATSSAGTPASSCGSAPCYEATAGQTLVTAVIKTNPAPSWNNWQSWRAGFPAGLDGTDSVDMGDNSSMPGLEWQLISGPSSPVWSSHTEAKPTLNGIVFGNYRVQLVARNGSGSATATQDIGAVATDSNGVVINSDPRVAEIFGPQIAFGQNPWGWEDERDFKTVLFQTAYQAANYDKTWYTPGQGTVSYPFAGKGIAPGPACTTLSSGIGAADMSIPVSDASCLSLGNLPTWILIGNSFTSLELVRVCGTSATSGPAMLTVCYDGRGLSGNARAIGGWANTIRAQAWPSGTTVGEFRIQGTSTLFSTDPNRPICPAGVPGPIGQVAYSTGTVTIVAGSTTVSGSGTVWNSGNGVQVGGFIRVSATHGGIPFVYWAQITAITDASHIVVNRPAPAGVDPSAFSYKFTSPNMFLSLEFTWTDGHIARMIFNAVGCESDTAMFALATHDVSQIDSAVMTGVHYSYKTFVGGIYSTSGTFTSNFYGVGIAARNFYYRSGYGPALDLANAIDEFAVRDPEIGDGLVGGLPLSLGGTALGAMIDLALNRSTALTWQNVEQFARNGQIGSLPCSATDTRDGAYLTAWLTLAANYDSNAANQAAFTNALQAALSRDQACIRNAADGYTGAEVNSFAHSFVWGPANSGSPNALTLTNGSTAVTGSGFTNGTNTTPGYCYGVDIIMLTLTNGSSMATVASGALSQQTMIWFYDGSQVGVFEYTVAGTAVQLSGVWTGVSGTFPAMSTLGGPLVIGGQVIGGYGSIWTDNTESFTNNRALEKAWACKFNSPSSLTLFRPWDGPSGSSYHISYYNVGAFGQQPFMTGIKTIQMLWATRNSNPAIASGYAALLPKLGNWYNSFGYDAGNTKGTFYDTIYQACGSPTDVPAGAFNSIHGYQGCGSAGLNPGVAAIARVNSAEGGAAMIQYYLADPTPARRAAVDSFYGAIFGYVPYCASSVLMTCDGIFASQLTDGDLSFSKWPGFFFGMGGFFSNSWPAVRLGGVERAQPRQSTIACNISSVANAAKCRITLTSPDGTTSVSTCNSSPCSVTVDARQGQPLAKVDYLSASDAVLAPGDAVPLRQ